MGEGVEKGLFGGGDDERGWVAVVTEDLRDEFGGSGWRKDDGGGHFMVLAVRFSIVQCPEADE